LKYNSISNKVANMKFGELTIAQIPLSAFSGIAVAIISWVIPESVALIFPAGLNNQICSLAWNIIQ
jgi:ABC-type uncharacterized transport system permease subunit